MASNDPSASSDSDFDIDRYFNESEKHLEIERVLQCFKLDPFAILELPYRKPDSKAIKMAYRKKSLMIHPDKVKHEKAEDAFSMLKKAESELKDEARLKHLLSLIEEAKYEIVREAGHKIKTSVVEVHDEEEGRRMESATVVDEESYPFLKEPKGQHAIGEKLKHIMVESELRRRRLAKREMEQQGEEARKIEELVQERKRKADDAKRWEETRDTRVNNWRSFQKKGKIKRIRKSGL